MFTVFEIKTEKLNTREHIYTFHPPSEPVAPPPVMELLKNSPEHSWENENKEKEQIPY